MLLRVTWILSTSIAVVGGRDDEELKEGRREAELMAEELDLGPLSGLKE